MAFIPYRTFLVLGASILSASAQLTPAPAATPAPAGAVLPLTAYSFTYPNLVCVFFSRWHVLLC
jgi:hypothetical protein